MSYYLRKRLEKLERQRPYELPPLIVDPDISPEEVARLAQQSIQEYGIPCLVITRERPTVPPLRGESD